MTPKERRDRLLKVRPFIRELKLIEGDRYSEDLGILWVGYKKKSYEWLPPELTQDDFAKEIERISKTEELLVVEDKTRKFKSGQGIIALVSLVGNDWKFEPHVQFMPWATSRNILRSTVAFFQYIRYSKRVGVCVVYTLESKLFDKVCLYGVLHKVGKIVNGDPRGDEILYTVSGKRKPNVHKTRREQDHSEYIQSESAILP